MAREIALTQGKIALVDEADYDTVAKYKWSAYRRGRTFYAETASRKPDGTPTTLQMHRLILSSAPRVGVDHIDGDGLNNQRHNLRPASNAENQRNSRRRTDNTTGYKGVTRRRARFRAQIRVDGKRIYLGSFDTPQAAYEAYCRAASELHGEFARTE